MKVIIIFFYFFLFFILDALMGHGRGHMIVGFTTTIAISAYHH